jgi:aryl-alcohol dehydrogenase-like predicted oxidoreductase
VRVVPIPGTKHVARLEENSAAARLRLTEQDLAALEPIAGRVAGAGSPPVPAAVARGD